MCQISNNPIFNNKVIINDQLLADPTFQEEKLADFKLTFGAAIDLQENNVFIQKGNVSDEKLKYVIILDYIYMLMTLIYD